MQRGGEEEIEMGGSYFRYKTVRQYPRGQRIRTARFQGSRARRNSYLGIRSTNVLPKTRRRLRRLTNA
eukprot:1478209-Rhodomonas_salina.3